MGFNISYKGIDYDEINEWNSNTSFSRNGMFIDSISRQNNDEAKTLDQYSLNALYVEPIGKKFFAQTFFNYRNTQEDQDRIVTDKIRNEINFDQSRVQEFQLDYYRIGEMLRYAHNGINANLGLAYLIYDNTADYQDVRPENNLASTQYNVSAWQPYFFTIYATIQQRSPKPKQWLQHRASKSRRIINPS